MEEKIQLLTKCCVGDIAHNCTPSKVQHSVVVTENIQFVYVKKI